MKQGLGMSCELLDCRLALMRDLASSLEQAQSAVLHSDFAGIGTLATRQEQICQDLRLLPAAPRLLPAATADSGESIPPLIRERWESLTQEIAQVEMQVNQLNHVYGALLRRARRTLEIFNRVLASSAITYRPPRPEAAAISCSREEPSHV